MILDLSLFFICDVKILQVLDLTISIFNLKIACLSLVLWIFHQGILMDLRHGKGVVQRSGDGQSGSTPV